MAWQPEPPVEPDRAPESILSEPPPSAHSGSTSLKPVDLRALGFNKKTVGPAKVGGAANAPAPRARRSRWSRALYAGCGVLLVAGGVAFGLARARALRLSDAQAATASHWVPLTRGATSLPSAPPTGASSPVEPSSATPGKETPGAANAADTPAPAPPAPTAAAANTGTLVLTKKAHPGSVWLDGVKITDTSTSVACGKHEIRVKGWHKHEIRVPCGGEVRVAR